MEKAQREALELLVGRFSEALMLKLVKAEEKHGWNGAWQRDGWASELRAELLRHLDKGDPLDVAAYAAFAWHHGWSTAVPVIRALPFEVTAVDQTVLGVGNPRANCFQACLAMVSGLPLSDCIDITHPDVGDYWVSAVEHWALQFGWIFRTGIRPPEGRPYIANGPTQDRQGVHGVVCLNDDVIHDPHPSREGIVSASWYGWLQPIGACHG